VSCLVSLQCADDVQEPRLGRWATDKQAKNAVFIVPLVASSGKDGDDSDEEDV
jgi:hypothetical protein